MNVVSDSLSVVASKVFDEDIHLPKAAPENRKSGEEVVNEDFKLFPEEKWFSVSEISDSLFEVINGNSFNELTPVSRGDLRYLKVLHKDFEGKSRIGELICNQEIADELLEIFLALYRADYPIERIVLVEEFGSSDSASMATNNTSCFNSRRVPGSRTLSKHAYGLAIDLNPLYNPLVKIRNGRITIMPEEGNLYADRSIRNPHQITASDTAYRLFKQYGFRWGGDWRSAKDYQHFEKSL